MRQVVQSGPEGITIHLPPLPSGLAAVLWLTGFGVVLILVLALTQHWKRRKDVLERAGTVWEHVGNLARRFYLAILIPLGLAAMVWAGYTYLYQIPPLISALLAKLASALSEASNGANRAENVRNYAYAFAALAGSLAFLATVPFQLARVWINERNARNSEENLTTALINKAVEGLRRREDRQAGRQGTDPAEHRGPHRRDLPARTHRP